MAASKITFTGGEKGQGITGTAPDPSDQTFYPIHVPVDCQRWYRVGVPGLEPESDLGGVLFRRAAPKLRIAVEGVASSSEKHHLTADWPPVLQPPVSFSHPALTMPHFGEICRAGRSQFSALEDPDAHGPPADGSGG